MACQKNRAAFFEYVSRMTNGALTTDSLERLYYSARQNEEYIKSSGCEQATLKTQQLFDFMKSVGIVPPTHSKDGLPKANARFGYAYVYDLLNKNNFFASNSSVLYQVDEKKEEEYDADGFNKKTGRNRMEYDKFGFDKNCLDYDGYNFTGVNPTTNTNRAGYRIVPFAENDFTVLFVNSKGRVSSIYTPTEHPTNENDAGGLIDDNGYDYTGYKTDPQNMVFYDADGYDVNGYDRDGFDRAGYNASGNKKNGETLSSLEKNSDGFYSDGRDSIGFDKYGVDEHYDFFYGRRFSAKSAIFLISEEDFLSLDNGNIADYENIINRPKRDLSFLKQGLLEKRHLLDPKACQNRIYLQCPYCKKTTGGDFHKCSRFPEFNSVKVYRSGVVASDITTDGITNKVLIAIPGDHFFTKFSYMGGYDPQTGLDENGFNRNGFSSITRRTKDGYDQLGYNQFGFDRQGYDRNGFNIAGINREGKKREVSNAEELDRLIGAKLLNSDQLAAYYGKLATALVGKPRKIIFRIGKGFATDLQGSIYADPMPLPNQGYKENLIVTRAGIEHEVGHELFSSYPILLRSFDIANGQKATDGLELGYLARGFFPRVLNIIEDGRMERLLAKKYPGVGEILYAQCRLFPRWDEKVGDKFSTLHQIYGSLLYTALPFFKVSDPIREKMSPKAREMLEEFEPLVLNVVKSGTDVDAFDLAFHISQRLEEEGFFKNEDEGSIKKYPLPPIGDTNTEPKQINPKPVTSRTNKESDLSGPADGAQRGRPRTSFDDGSDGQAGGEDGDDPSDRDSSDGGQAGGEDECDLSDRGGSDGGQTGGEDEGDPSDRGSSDGGQIGGEDKGDPSNSGGSDGQTGRPRTNFDDEADSFANYDRDLDGILKDFEKDVIKGVNDLVSRSGSPKNLGNALQTPLSSNKDQDEQKYLGLDGSVNVVDVEFPRGSSKAWALTNNNLANTKKSGKDLARPLRNIRDDVEATLRRRYAGSLDKHQIINAIKGADNIYNERRNISDTSFAVSMNVDVSGSMGREIRSGLLRDAVMVLDEAFNILEIPSEVRAFGSFNRQLRSLGDKKTDLTRIAWLSEAPGDGSTQGYETTMLSTTALKAREEKNRLSVTLSDGDFYDHEPMVLAMRDARKNGILTFGVFLGIPSDQTIIKLNAIYGIGNWAQITDSGQLPIAVGKKISALFKKLA
ncbi:MAG: hypothetical protein AB9888_13050 [Bacteroidales bacterium]